MAGPVGTGDLARSLVLRRNLGDLKRALARHSEELVSGRAASPVRALRGDVAGLAALEHALATFAAQATALAETAAFQAGQQRALARLVADARDRAPGQLALQPTAPETLVEVEAGRARIAFEEAVAAFNLGLGGRTLFAGARTDGPALAPAAAILDALAADVGAAADLDALEAAVDAWFRAPGGGFEAVALRGSAAPPGPVLVAPGETAELPLTVAGDAARRHLAALALGALASRPPAAVAGREARVALIQRAGERLLASPDALVALGAELGAAEARVAAAQARNGAETLALQLARNDLVGADPFEAGTRIEDVRSRIEALFALTARLQRLSLVEYLR